MPRMYPATVRRQIVSRLRSGESVAAVAAETGICQATLSVEAPSVDRRRRYRGHPKCGGRRAGCGS
jgi:transposase-like protein